MFIKWEVVYECKVLVLKREYDVMGNALDEVRTLTQDLSAEFSTYSLETGWETKSLLHSPPSLK